MANFWTIILAQLILIGERGLPYFTLCVQLATVLEALDSILFSILFCVK